MAGRRSLTQTEFDALLDWLDSDREKAGARLLEIRTRLTRMLLYRRALGPEGLVDETVDRVARKVREIRPGYSGDPALFFLGVARNVHRESLRTPRVPGAGQSSPAPQPGDGSGEVEHECLEQCMEALSPESRKLILDYYQDAGRTKIDNRRTLARALGIDPTALRNRAHRIRSRLYGCVKRCTDAKKGGAG